MADSTSKSPCQQNFESIMKVQEYNRVMRPNHATTQVSLVSGTTQIRCCSSGSPAFSGGTSFARQKRSRHITNLIGRLRSEPAVSKPHRDRALLKAILSKLYGVVIPS
jgi:hypothetical protein